MALLQLPYRLRRGGAEENARRGVTLQEGGGGRRNGGRIKEKEKERERDEDDDDDDEDEDEGLANEIGHINSGCTVLYPFFRVSSAVEQSRATPRLFEAPVFISIHHYKNGPPFSMKRRRRAVRPVSRPTLLTSTRVASAAPFSID